MSASSNRDELQEMIQRGSGVVPAPVSAAGGRRRGRRLRPVDGSGPSSTHRETGARCRHLLCRADPARARWSRASASADSMEAAVAAAASRADPRDQDQRRRQARRTSGRRPKSAPRGPGEEPGGLHPAVLGHDRRRPAARPVPRHPRQAGAAQALRATILRTRTDVERGASLADAMREASARVRRRCTPTWSPPAKRAVFSTRF